MSTPKFRQADIVTWKNNPYTKAPETVEVIKCRADDPREPFYMIRLVSDFTYTHAFESELEPYKADED